MFSLRSKVLIKVDVIDRQHWARNTRRYSLSSQICGGIGGSDNPLGVSIIHITSGGKVGYMVLGLSTL